MLYYGCAYNCSIGSSTYNGATITVVQMGTSASSNGITYSNSNSYPTGYTAMCKGNSLFREKEIYLNMLMAITFLFTLYAKIF